MIEYLLYELFGSGYFLMVDMMCWFKGYYFDDGVDCVLLFVSLFVVLDVVGVVLVMIVSVEFDLLCDEVEVYVLCFVWVGMLVMFVCWLG